MRLMDKSGSAHFEMIISFVFFVGFVFFLFLVLQPEDDKTLPSFAIYGLFDSCRENVSTNLSVVFLRANSSVGAIGPSCYQIDVSNSLFSYSLENAGVVVFNLSGDEINSNFTSDDLYLALNLPGGNKFLKLSFSPEFSKGAMVGCDPLTDYEFGSVIERRVFSNRSLVNMRDRYYSDYYGLRKDLGVPESLDFAVIAESLSFDMKPSSGIPGSIDVVTKDIVAEVIYENGALVNERFSFMVW